MKEKIKKIATPVILVFVALFLIGLFLIGRYFESGKNRDFKTLISDITGVESEKVFLPSTIITTADGAAYVPPTVTGTAIKIEGNIINAVLTPDEKTIVALESDGNLFITDLNLSKKTSIADNADCLIAVKDEGIIYKDTKHCFYRYLFADGSVVSLGKVTDYVVSENKLNIAFADKRGNIYILPASSAEREKVGSYSHRAKLNALSDNAGTLVYADIPLFKQEATFKLYDNGETTILFDDLDKRLVNDYGPVYTTFSTDGTSFIIHDFWRHQMFVRTVDKELITMDNVIAVSFNTSKEIILRKAFFGSLFKLDLETTEQSLLAVDTSLYAIANNTLYYTDRLNDLYVATIEQDTVTNETKIDSNVSTILCSDSGDYLYYIKDCDEYSDIGTLCGYRHGFEPIEIDSSVYTSDFKISPDEKTIYYFTNKEFHPYESGSLKKYTFGTDESVQIDTVVHTDSLKFGSKSEYNDEYTFIYKTNSVWKYYNGTEITIFINNITDSQIYFDR